VRELIALHPVYFGFKALFWAIMISAMIGFGWDAPNPFGLQGWHGNVILVAMLIFVIVFDLHDSFRQPPAIDEVRDRNRKIINRYNDEEADG